MRPKPARAPLTPWDVAVPTGTVVVLRPIRFPGRNHPRIVVALSNWTGRGLRLLHLTRPVAYVAKRGKPAWIVRALGAVQSAIDGQATPLDLARIAQRAHRGAEIPRRLW